MTRKVLFAIATLISSVAAAGGHGSRAVSTSSHASSWGGGSFHGNRWSSGSSFSSGGSFSSTGTGFSRGGFGGSSSFGGGSSEVPLFQSGDWSQQLKSVWLAGLRYDRSTFEQPGVRPAPAVPQQCCAVCAPAAAPTTEEHAARPRRIAAKPVIIDVEASDDVPRVWVVPGPVDLGHRTTLR